MILSHYFCLIFKAIVFLFFVHLHKIGLNMFLFLIIPMFYTLVLHVLGKVLVKSRGRFGVVKYKTFCLLTRF